MRSRFCALALLAGTVASVTACPRRAAIRIAAGSTAERIVFRISERPGGDKPTYLGLLRVDRCENPPDYRSES
jgi:hypothetical protein